jgi:hypothetical protein
VAEIVLPLGPVVVIVSNDEIKLQPELVGIAHLISFEGTSEREDGEVVEVQVLSKREAKAWQSARD